MPHEHDMNVREPGNEDRGKHGWLWMVVCCIPMIAVIVLVALGVWGGR